MFADLNCYHVNQCATRTLHQAYSIFEPSLRRIMERRRKRIDFIDCNRIWKEKEQGNINKQRKSDDVLSLDFITYALYLITKHQITKQHQIIRLINFNELMPICLTTLLYQA